MLQFNLNSSYVLENNRVLLRPLKADDYHHLLEYSLHEPEIWKFNMGGANGAENLKSYIAATLEQKQVGKEYPFIVFDKATGKYAGSTRFYDIQPLRKTLQLGYTWYGKNFQGTGLNKNCKYLLLDFAFEQLDAERVGFGANNKNERSINAMKSIGCTVEGVMRSNGYDASGQRADSIVLSILKPEWQQKLKEQLRQKIEA